MWLVRSVRKIALEEDSDQDIENIKYVMANGFILVLTSYPLEISSTRVIAVLRIYAEYLVISCLPCMGPPITWPRDISLKDAFLQSWLSCKSLIINRMSRHSDSTSILRRQGSYSTQYLWRQGPISAWICAHCVTFNTYQSTGQTVRCCYWTPKLHLSMCSFIADKALTTFLG